jgi:hypothetical protein
MPHNQPRQEDHACSLRPLWKQEKSREYNFTQVEGPLSIQSKSNCSVAIAQWPPRVKVADATAKVYGNNTSCKQRKHDPRIPGTCLSLHVKRNGSHGIAYNLMIIEIKAEIHH